MEKAVICAVLWIALIPAASAETGGYPASPSHGVTGTNPDGTPHYGHEPNKGANPSASTAGRSTGNGPDRTGAGAAPDATKPQDGK